MPTILSGNPTGTIEEFQDSSVKVGNPQIFNTPAPASYAAAASRTYTAADILGGKIVDAGNGASAHTATLPTAALLAAAMRAISARGVIAGDEVWCLIINGSNGAGTFTLVAGAGGTFDVNQAGAAVVAQNGSKEIVVRFTNGVIGSEAYTLYS
jgi:hypothetical protein